MSPLSLGHRERSRSTMLRSAVIALALASAGCSAIGFNIGSRLDSKYEVHDPRSLNSSLIGYDVRVETTSGEKLGGTLQGIVLQPEGDALLVVGERVHTGVMQVGVELDTLAVNDVEIIELRHPGKVGGTIGAMLGSAIDGWVLYNYHEHIIFYVAVTIAAI